MRLRIGFTIDNFTFFVNCVNARLDWSAGEIKGFVPDNFLDLDCCSFNQVFGYKIKDFDKITISIKERSGLEHEVILEKVQGSMEIVKGDPIFLYNEVKRQYFQKH